VFDQARTSLNPEQSLEEALIGDAKSFVWNGVEYTAVAWGKRFLFKPEQMTLPIKKLSGGEQARVLISRLMRTPADILILDEPTSSLDIETDEAIRQSIHAYTVAHGTTTIIIAHRMSTIRDADYVIRLDNGRVVAQGAPDHILSKVLDEDISG
jgi:ATP-binding cassette subfamily F protein uup